MTSVLLTFCCTALMQLLQGTKYKEGTWRAYRVSGLLLELSAWTAQQQPCLQHHLSEGASEDKVLRQLQQTLQTRRKARQAALKAAYGPSAEHAASGADAAGSGTAAAGDAGEGAAERGFTAAGGTSVGGAMWSAVLVSVATWTLHRKCRGVVAVTLLSAAAVVYSIGKGQLLADEASLQQLARLLEANSTAAILVRGLL
jgi:hypothetical protein